jgi:hypothetical protein
VLEARAQGWAVPVVLRGRVLAAREHVRVLLELPEAQMLKLGQDRPLAGPVRPVEVALLLVEHVPVALLAVALEQAAPEPMAARLAVGKVQSGGPVIGKPRTKRS